MLAVSTIRKKRDGQQLSADEISWFVQEFVEGRIADYQMSAFAMAVCIRGMTVDETVALTLAMLQSGCTLGDESQPRSHWVDKHSTGGLGDKVSLILAPALACCGVQVPMISGRGLGITGGTLDKLESIPGFQSDRTIQQIRRQLDEVGCVICGASDELAPADRRLYALRDVTGTVESIPLITASILSKKLAESISSLVLDVKVGSGTFMKTLDDAHELATMLVRVGNRLGVRTRALITNMHQPLGCMIGNTVEVNESLDVLRGEGPADVRQLTVELGANLLVMERRFETVEEAQQTLTATLDDGSALRKFEQMVHAQGGHLPNVPVADQHSVIATSAGVVQRVCGRTLGEVMTTLGGARRLAGQAIDHSVGLQQIARLGDQVEAGDELMRVFCHGATHEVSRPLQQLLAAFSISENVAPAPTRPLIEQMIREDE